MCDSLVSFENTEVAFAYKTDPELKKAKFLFSSMGVPILVKMGTALTPWAINAGLPVKGLIRNTIFQQFVGGESLEETAGVVAKLQEHKVTVILDYGVEGGDHSEEAYDKSTLEFIKVIEYAATQPAIPFMSIKVTGLARFALLEQIDGLMCTGEGCLSERYETALTRLDEKLKEEWNRVMKRLDAICSTAAEKNVGVLVDAEESWIQNPVDAATTVMMQRYNKSEPVVYNTVQLYRHDRLNFLLQSHENAARDHYVLGVKLVRGAYMEKERKRAKEQGYASPIQPDKNATDIDYDTAVQYSLTHIDQMATIIASHNEQSNLKAVNLLKKQNIPFNHPHVHFSQLYGMSDNITFNLARAGCAVSKYLPFGPLEEVTPYLMRRAQENSSVAGQTGRELGLIKKELLRRGI